MMIYTSPTTAIHAHHIVSMEADAGRLQINLVTGDTRVIHHDNADLLLRALIQRMQDHKVFDDLNVARAWDIYLESVK